MMKHLNLVQPRTAIIELFRQGGTTKSGIYVEAHNRIPKVFANVIMASSDCRRIKNGDVIVIKIFSYDDFNIYPEYPGLELKIINENNVIAILEEES